MRDAVETVELPEGHPGFADPAYRTRRAAIAAIGRAYRPGDPIPDVEYSREEDRLWETVSSELARKHRRFACAEYLAGASRLQLPTDRVPQLREVDERVRSLTGFGIQPVAGLVSTNEFFGALAARRFPCTQYIRHHTAPFYTPEPDIVHEIIGHANSLASPVFADLCQAAGGAALRVNDTDALDFFSRVFWFTLEFGVVWERGVLKAYGAGLLSSYGEIEEFRSADIRPWDLGAMGTQEYDYTVYQPVLFAAESFARLADDLGAFFEDFDEETHRRLTGGRA
jgi:phenylalanine-4-hydroxylase